MTALSVPGRLALHRHTVRRLTCFAAIGAASTIAYVLLYAGLRPVMSAGMANAVALAATAVANTAANRRLTFEVRGRDGLARDHAAGLVALGAALAVTSAALGLLDALAPSHGRLTEIAVLVVANTAATLTRFALLRVAIEGARSARGSTRPVIATLSQSKGIRG